MTVLPFEVSLSHPNNILAYYSNFVSMGIFEIPFGLHRSDDNMYSPILQRYNCVDYENYFNSDKRFVKITLEKGYYNITDFGKLFIRACNMKQ
jgi:hypothetical protein